MAVRVGSAVMYAGAPYVVVAHNGDLLVLDGLVSGRSVRERTTVLECDVRVVREPAHAGERTNEEGQGDDRREP